jgi:hypothetical protein
MHRLPQNFRDVVFGYAFATRAGSGKGRAAILPFGVTAAVVNGRFD